MSLDENDNYPIVELEASSPHRIGKLGLFDFEIPVGSTGVVFVGAVGAILSVNGPVFSERTKQVARRRAGSTLAQWGIVSAETFRFLREAIPLTQQEASTWLGVPLASLQSWESGQQPVPWGYWTSMAEKVCTLDGCFLGPAAALGAKLTPRVVRIFPDVPLQSTQQSES